MFSRIALLAIFASVTFASQLSYSEVERSDGVFVQNLKSKIDVLLAKLQGLIDKAVGVAHNEIDVAKNAVNSEAAKVVDKTRSVLTGLEKVFINELNALKDKAKKSGVNIDTCLGQDETDLLNLPTRCVNDAIGCVQGYVNTVFNKVDDILSNIQKVADVVLDIKQEMSGCGKGIKSVACHAKVVLKITKDIVYCPYEIYGDAKDAVHTITNVIPELAHCGSVAEVDFKTRGTALLAKISTCVAEQIAHKKLEY